MVEDYAVHKNNDHENIATTDTTIQRHDDETIKR
jgi:hypothetical protein